MTSVQHSTFEDSTETTIKVIQQTTGSSMTSSSSRTASFYFTCMVLIVTVVGAAANGLVLYAMVVSKQHKKQVLIFNQNALDFVNCLITAIVVSIQLSNFSVRGTGGYWLCLILLSHAINSAAYYGSLINLAAISIERYLKIVHHVWANNNLHNWIIYSVMGFTWISGIVISAALAIPSTTIINGICYSGIFSLSEMGRKIYGIWDCVSFYVIMLLIFFLCYGRILMVIRHQSKVMAAHSGQGSNTTQDQSNKMQTSIIKTMILVCVLFAITAGPASVYSLLINFHVLPADLNGLYVVWAFAYVYMCTNPFIYAIKFNPVKNVLLGLIPCKKSNIQGFEIGGNT